MQTTLSHPFTTSHKGQDPAILEKMGITPGLIRLSVGLEDPEDLWEDFRTGLQLIRENPQCSALSSRPGPDIVRIKAEKTKDGLERDNDPFDTARQLGVDFLESLLQHKELEQPVRGFGRRRQ